MINTYDAVEAGRETYRILIGLLTDNQLDFKPRVGKTVRQQLAELASRLGVNINGKPLIGG